MIVKRDNNPLTSVINHPLNGDRGNQIKFPLASLRATFHSSQLSDINLQTFIIKKIFGEFFQICQRFGASLENNLMKKE